MDMFLRIVFGAVATYLPSVATARVSFKLIEARGGVTRPSPHGRVIEVGDRPHLRFECERGHAGLLKLAALPEEHLHTLLTSVLADEVDN
jgi:hypothetical protein